MFKAEVSIKQQLLKEIFTTYVCVLHWPRPAPNYKNTWGKRTLSVSHSFPLDYKNTMTFETRFSLSVMNMPSLMFCCSFSSARGIKDKGNSQTATTWTKAETYRNQQMETNLFGVKRWLWQHQAGYGRGPGINGSVQQLLQTTEYRLGKCHTYHITESAWQLTQLILRR